MNETQTTRRVRVLDFVLEPPALLTSETAAGPSGRLRTFTQKVQVTDPELWRRLTADVSKGDTISVTVNTVWPDNGHYYTCLDGFALQEAAALAPELASAAA